MTKEIKSFEKTHQGFVVIEDSSLKKQRVKTIKRGKGPSCPKKGLKSKYPQAKDGLRERFKTFRQRRLSQSALVLFLGKRGWLKGSRWRFFTRCDHVILG